MIDKKIKYTDRLTKNQLESEMWEYRWHLHNFHLNKKEIEKLKSELEEYRKMDGVKAQIISDMPMSRSGESKQESVLFSEYKYKGECLDLIDYIIKLELDLHKLMRINRAIESVYIYLKEPVRSIIEMRYFITPKPNDVRQRKCNWQEIADEVHYSVRRCQQIDEGIVLQVINKLHNV